MPITISGSGTISTFGSVDLTATRADTVSEGGQVNFARASDNINAWAIDAYGGGTTPALRFINSPAGTVPMSIINATGYVSLAYGLTYPDGTSQTSGGFPNFANAPTGTLTSNTWYQATANWFVNAYTRGPYTNDHYLYAGPSTTTYYTIGQWGDDINSNTKWTTWPVFIRKGNYVYINSETVTASNYWAL